MTAPVTAAVLRACHRSAALTHEELKIGLSSLATISCVAPWLGLFVTVWIMPGAFVGCGNEKSTCMAATFSGLSQSIWPTALGLLIGLISLWCYRYLSCTLGTFDREMECASLELTNQLTRYRGTWTTQFTPKADTDRSIFAACHSESWRYSMPVTTVALVLAWFLEAARSFYLDSLPLALVLWPALKYVGLIFALSCAPAQLLWVRVLHHRHDLRLVMASALCLAWCVADLAFDVHLL